ncbi:DUF4033 domain-containing protein [Pseudanabaena sp. FACHB-2040]|uniref:DUF4033 domain-containing protein n=1 Tax=Pseudanabaena sp. FACHB-2040 TaxID=2692859 RepID=UPI0016890DF6|nr:DUF4033 domain-containing protein [Pseudanabaena sp. FACHB-2040]MBD2259737.1 DUF4033 domain-containing protein [Pseudanabaena sp. FACHB-2040]
MKVVSPAPDAKVTVEKTIYQDSLIDRLCIWLFSRKMAKAVGQKTRLKGYDGLVDLSKQMMQGRNAQEQKNVVLVVLNSLLPSQVLALVRKLVAPNQLVCELNAWFATRMFGWLVGPSEVRQAEVTGPDGDVNLQKSAVYIKKCRYLEQSQCAAMCVNMCKLPTQEFFAQEFGIPLTMTPNFEDYSCEMVFGQMPLPIEEEAAYNQPCLAMHGGTTPSTEACPKIRN